MFDPYRPVPSSQFAEQSSQAASQLPDDRTGVIVLILPIR